MRGQGKQEVFVMKTIGTISRGIKAPIIKKGDNLVDIVVDSVLAASEEGKFELQDKDVVAMTEAIVARAQGNYATLEQIAKDVRQKTGGGTVGLVFPIMSRNRFSMILKGIAMGVDKLIIQLSYPSDEVGNPLIPMDIIDEKGVNPYTDVFTEEQYYATFGKILHPFTGLDYIELYKSFGGDNCEIILANNPKEILKYTDKVINADIHTRNRTKRILKDAGAKVCLNLTDILNKSVDGSGWNEYGLYGSNLATDNSIKLFPRDGQKLVDAIADKFKAVTGKNIEVMIYGDGAFKDPVGGIWELADTVVSPAYTKGLEGTPNELKLKYLADNALGDLTGEDAKKAMKELIKEKKANLVADQSSQGTTPRRLTDLLGSLCDLTSGSGDKGTPIILIQNYFTN
ncbi:MAG: coenzyme F420-0:L-glutamate ligase, partial [Clostridia bacterium]|nr:coenzyme F420-0:L-glutamate ligase [Clostridia bacterium]